MNLIIEDKENNNVELIDLSGERSLGLNEFNLIQSNEKCNLQFNTKTTDFRKDFEFKGVDNFSNKKIVLITNCQNGELGHFLAKVYLRKKHHVIATAPNLLAMSYLNDDPHLDKVVLDFNNSNSLDKCLNYLSNSYPRIDMIILTPTLDIISPIITLKSNYHSKHYTSTNELIFKNNVIGPLELIQPISLWMCKNQTKGLITFIGNTLTDLPTPFNGLFIASMKAMETLANTLRLELLPFNVGVILIRLNNGNSGVLLNNLRVLNFEEDNPYKAIKTTIQRSGIWERKELRTQHELFSNVIYHITINRHSGAHTTLHYINPFYWLIYLLFKLLIQCFPELTNSLNFFLLANGYGWPIQSWQYTFTNFMDWRLVNWSIWLPNFIWDWYRWDQFNLGYLGLIPFRTNKDLLNQVKEEKKDNIINNKPLVNQPTATITNTNTSTIPFSLKHNSTTIIKDNNLSIFNESISPPLRQRSATFSYTNTSPIYANPDSLPNSGGSIDSNRSVL